MKVALQYLFENYIFSQILLQETMAGNPWQVESILAFYCLKCPECDFNTQEENNFVYHAKEYHPLSCVLFGQETTNGSAEVHTDFKEEINTAHIKQEQNSDLSYEDYYNYDDRVTTDNLPLSLSYPDISMNEEQGNLSRGIVNFFINIFSLFELKVCKRNTKKVAPW